jgi:hypothetical protein
MQVFLHERPALILSFQIYGLAIPIVSGEAFALPAS